MSAGGPRRKIQFDKVVPEFVRLNFPPGLVGLVFVGMFAAAMSSLDTTLNSLSAATVQDFVIPFWPRKLNLRRQLIASKLATFAWGVACLAFAFLVGNLSGTIVESINKIGSILYGPTLSLFILGVLTRRANGTGVVSGFIAGIVGNIALWVFVPSISWLWWNVIGFFVGAILGYLISLLSPAPEAERLKGTMMKRRGVSELPEHGETSSRGWRPYYLILAIFGASLIAILAVL